MYKWELHLMLSNICMQHLVQCIYGLWPCESVVYYGVYERLEFGLLVVQHSSRSIGSWTTLASFNSMAFVTKYIRNPTPIIGRLVIQPILVEL